MRSRSNDRCQPPREKSANSHFLGLECVLDKYQHQNHILSKKIEFLLSENKRLKQSSGNSSSQRQGHDSTRHLNLRYTINTDHTNNTGTDGALENSSNHELENRPPPPNFNLNLSLFKSQLHQGKNERCHPRTLSHSYRCQQSLPRESARFKYSQFEDSLSNSKPRQQLALQEQAKAPHRAPKVFTRQVYLERETVLIDDENDEDEKLPTFLEASFGNAQCEAENTFDQKKQHSRHQGNTIPRSLTKDIGSGSCQQVCKQQVKKELHEVSTPGVRKQKLVTYRLERTQQEKNQIRERRTITQISQTQEKQRDDLVVWEGKKTNFPYIKQDYKLAEPKTQLTKIWHGGVDKEEKENRQNRQNRQNRELRKTFLHVMSKRPKRSLFAK